MRTEMIIDWDCWEVETPSPGFADEVMQAVLSHAPQSAPVRRARRSLRWVGALAAAAVTVGSLTVLAMMGRTTRRDASRKELDRAAKGERAVAAPSSAATSDAIQPKGHVLPSAPHAPGTVVDRERRDGLRARLMAPLEAEGVERDPHTGLTIPSGSSGPSHNLSHDYVQARLHEDFLPMATTCYETALAKQPNLRGQVVIDFMIVGDSKVGGIVDQAKINERSDIPDPAFAECLRESMLSMVFAPPGNNGWVTVTYPFRFSPDEEDAGED